MLKEAFAILTQGVEMIHFDVSHSGRGTHINKKIIWMVCIRIIYDQVWKIYSLVGNSRIRIFLGYV